jgi:hypothetical protein
MKHSGLHKVVVFFLAILMSLGITSGLAVAGNLRQEGANSLFTVVDFEGLEAGTIVSSLSAGNGISGPAESGEIGVVGINPKLPAGTNAAMVFDAACPPGGTPESCTGGEYDLFAPVLGKVLIVSDDLDPSDPDTAGNRGLYFEFDFSNWGSGSVTVGSLDILDVEEKQTALPPRPANIELYSGGPDGTLLTTIKIPPMEDGAMITLPINVSGVDFMRVSTNGSGAIDNLRLLPKDVLYLVDTGKGRPQQDNDNKSYLYRVEIDEEESRAVLIPLPIAGGVAGELEGYNRVDALASTPDGSRLYFIDTDFEADVLPLTDKPADLAYYDLATATVVHVGGITVDGVPAIGIDQAAFSRDGTFYVSNTYEDTLYTLDPETAELTLVGTLVREETGAVLDVSGSDIAFSADGTLYIWVNRTRGEAPRGLYTLALPAEDGVVNATYLGGEEGSDSRPYRGLALRGNGTGDLVAYTQAPTIRVVSKEDGTTVLDLPMFLENGDPFPTEDQNAGDMTIGPFAP